MGKSMPEHRLVDLIPFLTGGLHAVWGRENYRLVAIVIINNCKSIECEKQT